MKKFFALLAFCLSFTAAFAEDAKPAPVFPPKEYTITLSADQMSTLLSIFQTAEMPMTHWGPVMDAIRQQIGAQNQAAQAAVDASKKRK